MPRPTIDLIIPVEKLSTQLDTSVALIQANTTNFNLHVLEDASVNVGECRQTAMENQSYGDIMVFLDYDSEISDPDWLDVMYDKLVAHPDAGAIYGREVWGTRENDTRIHELADEVTCEVHQGPAACMMIDRSRFTPSIKWDTTMGLKNGWLGGDLEDVDFVWKLRAAELKMYEAATWFRHTGGKTTFELYHESDRRKTIHIMKHLIAHKYTVHPTCTDFFAELNYVEADSNDDTMLKAGKTLKHCYRDLLVRHGLDSMPAVIEWGLV